MIKDLKEYNYFKEKDFKIEELSSAEKYALYLRLRYDFVREDVETYAGEYGDYDLSVDDIDLVAERFVYDGRYDCNLSYWDNIDNLINECCPEARKEEEDV